MDTNQAMNSSHNSLRPVQFVGALYKVFGWTMAAGVLISVAFIKLTNAIEFNLLIVVLSAIPVIVLLGVGKAITEEQHWGHSAGVVIGIIMLLSVPLGTLLGLVVLWCLLKADKLQPVSKQLHIFLIGLSIFLAVAVAAVAPYAVKGFGSLFEGFGSDLPLFTRLALDYYHVIFALPLLVIAVLLFWPKNETRTLAVVSVGTCGSMLVLQLLVFAMYFPVFTMGTVTQ